MKTKQTDSKSLCFVIGTRPEIIKIAPVIHACERKEIPHFLIHTGQHYSPSLDAIFFQDLKLSKPKYNLHVGSGSQADIIGSMVQGISGILEHQHPSVLLVHGDTNSALAGALAGNKSLIPVGHIEAGLRSHDRSMPEEINRIVIDHVSDILFAPTREAKQNLLCEGIRAQSIRVVGNTIVEAVKDNLPNVESRMNILKKFKLSKKNYGILTLHRPGNVDSEKRLKDIFAGIQRDASMPILFFIHPRTAQRIHSFGITVSDPIVSLPPTGYFDMLSLIKDASFVITDSGGLQEEACVLKTPCITIRPNTERPETLKVGSNVLVPDPKELASAFDAVAHMRSWRQPFGAGHSAELILKNLVSKEDYER